ncbi:hypothetical protein S83_013683 [Arachis hypogaea]
MTRCRFRSHLAERSQSEREEKKLLHVSGENLCLCRERNQHTTMTRKIKEPFFLSITSKFVACNRFHRLD